MRGTYDFISWLLLLTWAAAAKKSRATKNEIRSVDKKISSELPKKLRSTSFWGH